MKIGAWILRYGLHFVAATLGVMAITVVAVWTPTFFLGYFLPAFPAYPVLRLAQTPPYIFHLVMGLLLGYFLGDRVENRRCAEWAWIIPAAWMLLGTCVWTSHAGLSVWERFFSADWWSLPPSPFRARWVVDQFSHTAPLFTSIAYALGAFLHGFREHSRTLPTARETHGGA
jgi:hypothetical protein